MNVRMSAIKQNITSLLFLISVILFPIPDFANEKLHPSLSELVRTISEYRVVLLKWPLGEYFKNTVKKNLEVV